MQVFKFFKDEFHYTIAAPSEELAVEKFKQDVSPEFDSSEEIPESEWDERNVNLYVDNDISRKPFKVSIREMINGIEPQLICTNDYELIS